MKTIHLNLFMLLCLGAHKSSSEILQRQKRNWIIDSFNIEEGYKGPFPYVLGKIEIEKDLRFFKIHGQGVDEEPKGVLEINKDTGEITVHKPVDYEKLKYLKLMFQAFDIQNNVLDTQLGIDIQIIDSNDNPPKFTHDMYRVTIEESTFQGTILITIKATDVDSESNKLFALRIVSVTPEPHDLEFYLTQIAGQETGSISFKGCLDHEKAEKYTIIVEAKDHGESKRLSSSCTVIVNIEDGNNHLPVLKKQKGAVNVKEQEENVLVTRLKVTDEDTKGSMAWRAKYKILGDTNNNFRITTDPETNDGLLYVGKPLDHEESPMKNLTISVENEIPYHSCKVISRSTTGLWQVVTSSGTTNEGITEAMTLRLSTLQVTVNVENVNEPPVFAKKDKLVSLRENVKAGQYLETFVATDPDVTSANTFVYIKGNDPAGWVIVDQKTGAITTTKIFDRESSFVKDSYYNVTIYAVDNGTPKMTGTATLNIRIIDENDNAPYLVVSKIDMCQTNGSSLANITVLDLDEKPYGGPFQFKLLEDFGGTWAVDPGEGYSVKLTKEKTVYSGHFDLVVAVTDLQGQVTHQNLSVTVCSCINTARPNCRNRKATGSHIGGGALGIIFFGILLFAGALLLAFLMSCEEKVAQIPVEGLGQLMKFNTEEQGNDCKVTFERLEHGQTIKQIKKAAQIQQTVKKSDVRNTTASVSQAQSEHNILKAQKQWEDLHWSTQDIRSRYQHGITECGFIPGTALQGRGSMEQEFTRGNSMRLSTQDIRSRYQHGITECGFITGTALQGKGSMEQEFTRGNSMRWSTRTSSTMRSRYQHGITECGGWAKHGKYAASQESGVIRREILHNILAKALSDHQEGDLGDYEPHVYAEEDDSWDIPELEAISISDVSFDADWDMDLDYKFQTLASICTDYSTKTFLGHEKSATMQVQSAIQVESHYFSDQVINPKL